MISMITDTAPMINSKTLVTMRKIGVGAYREVG